LCRDLGVAVDDVVAIAEKLSDEGRWDFYLGPEPDSKLLNQRE
jgi:hypothetical protein